MQPTRAARAELNREGSTLQPELTRQRSMAIATFSEYYTLSFDLRKMANLASIAFFSSLGVLLRFGAGVLFSDYLQATVSTMERDPSGILFHDLVVNIIGSWMMGLFASFRTEIQAFSPALYVGLTTGLCGCATTFSAWVSSMVVLAWDFDDGCALYPFSALLGNIIGFGLAYTAHSVGEHFATCLRQGSQRLGGSRRAAQLLAPGSDPIDVAAGAPSPARKPPNAGGSAPTVSRHATLASDAGAGEDDDAAVVVSGEEASAPAPEANRGVIRYFYEWDVTSDCWELLRLGAALLLWFGLTAVYVALYARATEQRTRVLLLACIIAPVGAWLRYLVTFSNKDTPTFPLYTYLCNLVGSVLSIVIYVALTKVIPASEGRLEAGQQLRLQEWLLAISLGFCGCLTTVSSFVHEVAMLWDKATLYDAYFYAVTTLGSVHVICLAFLIPFSVHYSECENGPPLST